MSIVPGGWVVVRGLTKGAVVDREYALHNELFAGGDAVPVLARAETLRDGPHRLGEFPAVDGASACKLIHARADVLKLALAVVTPTVPVVWRAGRVLAHTDQTCVLDSKEMTYPDGRVRRIDPDHVGVLHDDVRARSVLRPEVVLAIEYKRDGMIPIQRIDQVVRGRGCVQWVRGAVRLVASVPEQQCGAIFDAVYFLGHRGVIHIRPICR